MEGVERREKILDILKVQTKPISGTELSRQLGVSRQVIVQDIALLRAINKNILSTTKGYILYYQEQQKVNRCFLVKHNTEEIEEELLTIVEHGGKVLDVIVSHQVYGQIATDLIIETKEDVLDFVDKIQRKKTVPLKELTNDVHFHTVEADSDEILDKIEQALLEKNFLVQ